MKTAADNLETGKKQPENAHQPAAGYVSRIFRSIQGEGPYVGQSQVFLRTAGCTLGCSWCDTEASRERKPWFEVYGPAVNKKSLPNPVDPETAVREVVRLALEGGPVDAVSITGGEPLEQPLFAEKLADRISGAGFPVYLETNGVHADSFARILPFVDVVAMDIKLPSAVGIDLWTQHGEFLSRIKGTPFDPDLRAAGPAAKHKDFFVKVVLDGHSRADEFEKAVQVVADGDRRIQFVIQPESETLLSRRNRRGETARFYGFLEECARRARTVLDHVRVIPQCHKILGVE